MLFKIILDQMSQKWDIWDVFEKLRKALKALEPFHHSGAGFTVNRLRQGGLLALFLTNFEDHLQSILKMVLSVPLSLALRGFEDV